MIERLGIVMCYVSEMAPAVAFYRAVLGARPVHESEHWSEFALPGGTRLGLHPGGSGGATGGFIPGLIVASLSSATERITAAGYAVPREPHPIPGGIEIELADPDGNRVQLIELGG